MGRKKKIRSRRHRYHHKPRNPANNLWQELYEIETRSESAVVGFDASEVKNPWTLTNIRTTYNIVDKNTKEILGKYTDYGYAINQARYKYKRQQKKINWILLSEGLDCTE